jgi:hypothetical protein
MSSPFQQSFSARSPFRNKGVVTLSEKDIKDAKSASSKPAVEISFEGQGGIDYENDPRFAENPEGQGGIDYESKDYKKKTESPLGSYANPAGMQYVSNKEDFQRLQNEIVSGYKASKASKGKDKQSEGKDKQEEKKLFPSVSKEDYSIDYKFEPKSYI